MYLENKKYLIGALTSKPYAFLSRSWELKVYESVDIYDNFGSNIRFDVNNLKILRILPKINKNLNENWITDKVRFCYDGLYKQRINSPLLREDNKLVPVTWLTALQKFKEITNDKYIESFCGSFVDLETMYIFKEFLTKLGYNSFNFMNFKTYKTTNLRETYRCSLLVKNLKYIKNLFLFGINIRLENPILNIKIRQLTLHSNLKIFNFNFISNLTYAVTNFGNNIYSFLNFLEGKSYLCSKVLNSSLNYMLIGYNLFYRYDSNFYQKLIQIFNSFFKNFIGSFFWQGANSYSSAELGSNQNILEKHINRSSKILYLLDMDDIFFKKDNYDYIIYQGHHGNLNLYYSDLVFAGVTPYEKSGIFMNLFGIQQKSNLIIKPTKKVKNDWKIIKALGDFCVVPLFYESHKDILRKINKIIPNNLNNLNTLNFRNSHYQSYYLENSSILNYMGNYYLTDIISRSSLVMSLCSIRFKVLNIY